MDFSNYKFRCSGLKHLMTSSRSKSDPLSETTKTYLRDIYISEVFGRVKPDITGPAALKGTMVESDSLDLYKEVTGKTHFKNQKHLENDYIQGTPDVITSDLVIDIKSSWNIWTFSKVDEKEAKYNYFYQVLGYMWLTGLQKSELAYCLVNTPEGLANDEIYKLTFKMSEEEAEKFRINHVFDDISPVLRVKRFEFEIDEAEIEKLSERIALARLYLNGLTL